MLQLFCSSDQLLFKSGGLIAECLTVLSDKLKFLEPLVIAIELCFVQISLFCQF